MASIDYLGSRGTNRYADNEKLGVNLKNSMQFFPWLRADFGLAADFSSSSADVGMGSYASAYRSWPSYYMLKDEQGNPLKIRRERSEEELDRLISIGAMDGRYSPITNREEEQRRQQSRYYRLQAGLNFRLMEGLDLDVKYQTELGNSKNRTFYSEDSYHVRSMINDAIIRDPESGELTFHIPTGGATFRRKSRP